MITRPEVELCSVWSLFQVSVGWVDGPREGRFSDNSPKSHLCDWIDFRALTRNRREKSRVASVKMKGSVWNMLSKRHLWAIQRSPPGLRGKCLGLKREIWPSS